ncbi:MAG: histidine kinase dimerization/phospho-acceptor domain-containing protein, partial [Bacteroidota bacterium]
MKKNVIIFVVILITLSLLGLIGIQLYWISNAFNLKESNFNRDVSEALTSAIYKYNKIEMAGIFFQEYEEDDQLNLIFNKLDSINHVHYEKIAAEIDSSAERSDTLSTYHEPYGFPNFDPFTGVPIDEKTDLPSFLEYQEGGYANRNKIPGNSDNLYWNFFQRSKIINDLFDELFSAQQNIKPALQQNISILDSLIKAEIERSGIRTKYEFGVYDPVYNTLISEKTGKYSEELLQTEYAYSLFPNDVFRSPEFLLIYFPNQQTYLLTQMNIMTIISGIFILVIISSFTYTIITIIKQKQLSLMKNDFINNMTHELKTPISTISLACQALRDNDVQKSENLYQNYINVINE